jgi:uncharacterized cupin superfamily protein
MRRINLATAKFEYDTGDPEGFRAGRASLGARLGATTTGMSTYELPPGQAVYPYHYEHAEEEWLLVLEGTPTLRHPGGEDRLEPWDVAVFPRGAEGAHLVRNDTDETVRVLMFSDVHRPAVTVFPDSDKVGVWTKDSGDDAMFRRNAAVGYFDGEGA